jgi:glutamate-1-semialdehyde aminotransferase
LLHGLHELQRAHPRLVTGVGGIAEMCFLHWSSEDMSRDVAQQAARRGILFKRTAYNFVSLAHDEGTVDRALAALNDALNAS